MYAPGHEPGTWRFKVQFLQRDSLIYMPQRIGSALVTGRVKLPFIIAPFIVNRAADWRNSCAGRGFSGLVFCWTMSNLPLGKSK